MIVERETVGGGGHGGEEMGKIDRKKLNHLNNGRCNRERGT